MPLIQPLNNVSEEVLQRYLGGTKSPELYEVTYISSLRPNSRNMDEIVLVQVVVRDWAVDARELLTRLLANPQRATIGREEHDLAVLTVVSVAPIAGNSGGGISQESMLEVLPDNRRNIFSTN